MSIVSGLVGAQAAARKEAVVRYPAESAGASFAGPTTLVSAKSGDTLTSISGTPIESQEPL